MPTESNNPQMPDWIARRQQEKAMQTRAEGEALQSQLDASKQVASGGPEFWARLTERLRINVDALPALGEELVGSVSLLTGVPELHCHVQVNRQSLKHGPELSHLNLWYRQGGFQIRRWYQDREMPDVILQPSRGTIIATIDNRYHLTAEQLADLIVERMADRVSASSEASARFFNAKRAV